MSNRLADDAPVPHPDSWPARNPPSVAYDATCDAVRAQAARTARRVIKERARAYALRPRDLDAISPASLVRAITQVGDPEWRRWFGFGGEIPALNLRGAMLYARYARAKAHQIARRTG
jgi:hypothetical protein